MSRLEVRKYVVGCAYATALHKGASFRGALEISAIQYHQLNGSLWRGTKPASGEASAAGLPWTRSTIATADKGIQRAYGVRRQSVSVDAALVCRAAQDTLTLRRIQSGVVGCAYATAVHKGARFISGPSKYPQFSITNLTRVFGKAPPQTDEILARANFYCGGRWLGPPAPGWETRRSEGGCDQPEAGVSADEG